MTIQELLSSAVEQRILRRLDIQFAMMVAGNDEPAVMLAAAILSKETGDGHLCLPLTSLVSNNKTPAPLQACFTLVGTIDWAQTLLNSDAVSEGDTPTPLILSAGRLYLNRIWRNELVIANFFSKGNQSLPYDKTLLKRTLNKLFGTGKSVNWQKVAAAVVMTRRISVISGGPGTGKTTTVAKLLSALIQMANAQKYRIQLAAPTGKAAVRLTESLSGALQYLPLTEEQRKYFPKQATTLHRLLGAQAGSQRLRYHADNPLHLDLLVVDEASMIDLIMMSRLIKALPPHAKVIFLGDCNQLASVEAGAILGDIFIYAREGYTVARAYELTQLTNCQIKGNPSPVAGALRDSLCMLQKSYRFKKDSGINQLAAAVNRGDRQAIKSVFNGTFRDIRKIALKTSKDYLKMLEEVLEGYLCFLHCVHQQKNPEKVLATFNQFQLLCALKEGPYGVTGLNENLEKLLSKTHNINYQPHFRWYVGRPVMISRNDYALGLFNGDVGIYLDRGEGLRVWFHMANGSMKSVHPNRLPEHETAWAMTVHKSQGSEFDHVSIILPPQHSTVVTRELVYTAITRARKRLSLYTDDHMLTPAVVTRAERRSGLDVIFKST